MLLKLKIKLRPYYFRFRNLIYGLSGKPEIKGLVLMLHRVDEWDSSKIYYNEHLKVSPKTLERHIQGLLRYFEPISVADIPDRIANPKSKPFVVFTMDDGYKDNLTKALPVFKKYNVPYTIFLATDFPDNEAVMWWYELEDLLLKHKSIKLSNGMVFPSETKQEKEESFLAIRQLILDLDQEKLEAELNNLFSSYDINWRSKVRELSLTWDDVEILKREPLVSIGGHTKHHYNLKQLKSKEEVQKEIKEGCDVLYNKSRIKPNSFAYPFGSPNEASEREYKAVEEMHLFDLGFKAFGGCIKDWPDNLYSLPREILLENTKLENIIFQKNYHT